MQDYSRRAMLLSARTQNTNNDHTDALHSPLAALSLDRHEPDPAPLTISPAERFFPAFCPAPAAGVATLVNNHSTQASTTVPAPPSRLARIKSMSSNHLSKQASQDQHPLPNNTYGAIGDSRLNDKSADPPLKAAQPADILDRPANQVIGQTGWSFDNNATPVLGSLGDNFDQLLRGHEDKGIEIEWHGSTYISRQRTDSVDSLASSNSFTFSSSSVTGSSSLASSCGDNLPSSLVESIKVEWDGKMDKRFVLDTYEPEEEYLDFGSKPKREAGESLRAPHPLHGSLPIAAPSAPLGLADPSVWRVTPGDLRVQTSGLQGFSSGVVAAGGFPDRRPSLPVQASSPGAAPWDSGIRTAPAHQSRFDDLPSRHAVQSAASPFQIGGNLDVLTDTESLPRRRIISSPAPSSASSTPFSFATTSTMASYHHTSDTFPVPTEADFATRHRQRHRFNSARDAHHDYSRSTLPSISGYSTPSRPYSPSSAFAGPLAASPSSPHTPLRHYASFGGGDLRPTNPRYHHGFTPATAFSTRPLFSNLGPSPNNKKGELFKTELCRSWSETNACRYNNRCQFAHGLSELRMVPENYGIGRYDRRL